MSFKKLMSAVLVLAACAVFPMANQADAKGFQGLSFNGSYQDRHPTPVNVWKPFFAEAEKKFNGKLTFDYFAQNLLFPEKESIDALNDGRGDFITFRPSVFPGTMNLMGVIDIPAIAPNAIVGSMVAWEVLEKFPEVRAEMPKNGVPYTAWSSAAYQLHTIKPVKTAADLKGKKIIVWDAVQLEVIKAMGGNPIRMDAPDTYLSLSKAMADGVICPLAPVRSYKISEVCKYHTIINSGVCAFNMFANKDLWESLPNDMRDWLKAEGGAKMALAVGKSLEDGQAVDINWMKEQGHEFFYLNDAQRDEFVKPLDVFKAQWFEDCAKAGVSKDVAEKIVKFTEERVKFHTEEMRKGTYGKYEM